MQTNRLFLMQCTQKMLEYLLTCRIILIVQRRPLGLQGTAVCHNHSGQVLTSFLHINAAVWIGCPNRNPKGCPHWHQGGCPYQHFEGYPYQHLEGYPYQHRRATPTSVRRGTPISTRRVTPTSTRRATPSKTPSGQTSVGRREGLARSPLHEKQSSMYPQLSKPPQ